MIKTYGDASDVNFPATKHPLYWRWVNMLGRCYDPKHYGYKSYGAKGSYVENYLMNFGNYVNFVSTLDNYNNLLCEPEKWEIDKDLSGKNYYSRETIQIIPRTMNLEIENRAKRIPVIQLTQYDEVVGEYNSIVDAERITGIHKGNIARAVRNGSNAGGYKWRRNIGN